MEYSEIQYVGKRVSRLFFGTCIRRMKAGENADDLLDAAFAAGINAFDTARGYGGAERSLGGWIDRRGNRADVVIQTKGGLNGFLWRSRVKERCVRADLERSLKELHTDYVDIYLLHRDDRRVPVGVIVEMLNELVCEGRVRAFGGSNWTYGRIEDANEYAYAKGLQPFTVSSPNFGLAVMEKDPWGGGLTTVTGEKNAAEREWYRRTGVCRSSRGRASAAGCSRAGLRRPTYAARGGIWRRYTARRFYIRIICAAWRVRSGLRKSTAKLRRRSRRLICLRAG